MAKINSGLGPIATFFANVGKHEDIKSNINYLLYGRYRNDEEGISQYFIAVTDGGVKQGFSTTCGVVYENIQEDIKSYSVTINPNPNFVYTLDFDSFGEYINGEGSDQLLSDTPIKNLGEGFCYWADTESLSIREGLRNVRGPSEANFDDISAVIIDKREATYIPTDTNSLFQSYGACDKHRGNKPYPYAFIAQPESGGEILGKSFWASTNGHALYLQPLEGAFYPPKVKVDLHWLKMLRGRTYKDLRIFAINDERTATFIQGTLPSGHTFRVSNGENYETRPTYEGIYNNVINRCSDILDNIVYDTGLTNNVVSIYEGNYLRSLFIKVSVSDILKAKKLSKWNTNTDMCMVFTHDILESNEAIGPKSFDFGLNLFSVSNSNSKDSDDVLEEPLLKRSYNVPTALIPGTVLEDIIKAGRVLEDGRLYWNLSVSGSLIKSLFTGAKVNRDTSLWVPVFYTSSEDESKSINLTCPLVISDDTCSIDEGGLCYFLMPLRSNLELSDASRLLSIMSSVMNT